MNHLFRGDGGVDIGFAFCKFGGGVGCGYQTSKSGWMEFGKDDVWLDQPWLIPKFGFSSIGSVSVGMQRRSRDM